MFVDNQNDFGYLIASEQFANLPENTINREIYDYPNNKKVLTVFLSL